VISDLHTSLGVFSNFPEFLDSRACFPFFFHAETRPDRGIDVVRNEIQSFASTMRFGSKGFKLIILDEC